MREFTADVRRKVKAEAKEQIRERRGRVMGVQVGATMITLLPVLIILGFMIANLFILLLAPTGSGVAALGTDALGQMVFSILGKILLCYVGLGLVTVLLSWPLSLGLSYFFARLAKKEDPRASTMFHAFTNPGRFWLSIRMGFCLWGRGFLWLLVPNLLFYTVYFSNIVTQGVAYVNTSFYIAYILLTFLISVKLQSYSAGWLYLEDGSCKGAWEATSKGTRLFRGMWLNLIMFDLSFFGWWLLILLVYMLAVITIVIGAQSNSIAFIAVVVTAAILVLLVCMLYLNAYILTAFFRLCLWLGGYEPKKSLEERSADMLALDSVVHSEQSAAQEQDTTDDVEQRGI